MLHIYSLSSVYLQSGWAIHPLTGSLLKVPENDISRFTADRLPTIVSASLNYCHNPYLLKPPSNSLVNSESKVLTQSDSIQQVSNKFKKISKLRALNFYASVIYAGVSSICVNDSKAAFGLIKTIDQSKNVNTCLEKCLTVAKCSASFRKTGVIFIGAHLPLQAMHAWILEDGEQPDKDDRNWINFLPLMAITHINK